MGRARCPLACASADGQAHPRRLLPSPPTALRHRRVSRGRPRWAAPARIHLFRRAITGHAGASVQLSVRRGGRVRTHRPAARCASASPCRVQPHEAHPGRLHRSAPVERCVPLRSTAPWWPDALCRQGCGPRHARSRFPRAAPAQPACAVPLTRELKLQKLRAVQRAEDTFTEAPTGYSAAQLSALARSRRARVQRACGRVRALLAGVRAGLPTALAGRCAAPQRRLGAGGFRATGRLAASRGHADSRAGGRSA